MALSGFMGVCVVCWPCANEGGVNGAEEAENKKPCLKMGAGEPTRDHVRIQIILNCHPVFAWDWQIYYFIMTITLFVGLAEKKAHASHNWMNFFLILFFFAPYGTCSTSNFRFGPSMIAPHRAGGVPGNCGM